MAERTKQNHQSQNDSPRARSAGFALLELITLLPLMAAILIGLSSVTILLSQAIRTHSQCTRVLFHYQDKISKELNDLLKLNPKALLLRKQYRIAQLRLQAAIASANTTRIAICEAKVIELELKRAALDSEQNTKIQTAEQLRRQMQSQATNKLREAYPKIHTTVLNVSADIPGDMAPAYRVLNNFRKIQTAIIEYNIRPPIEVNADHTPMFCAVSIEPRSQFYRATLVEANHDL